MQISDCGFRGELNVVNPGRRAGFSHVNARWNPALLLGLALLHVNTPLEYMVFTMFTNEDGVENQLLNLTRLQIIRSLCFVQRILLFEAKWCVELAKYQILP